LAEFHAIFVRPEGISPQWEQTDLWQSVKSIPDVQVISDKDGSEARRFDAKTSGEVRLYDVDGTLVFYGGITGARGHAGDNLGSDTVFACLQGDQPKEPGTFSFGCPLFSTNHDCGENGILCNH
jgi:hypothetical protein